MELHVGRKAVDDILARAIHGKRHRFNLSNSTAVARSLATHMKI
jgi:hypothetical protein